MPTPPRLIDLYLQAVETPSDINEHCVNLRRLSSRCATVVELGMRYGVSTTALLAGQPDRLISVDLHASPATEELMSVAGRTDFEFRLGSSLDLEIPVCDLLFIDTWHVEDQLWGELCLHAGMARRWIALHDTETYGDWGEGGGPGLLPALTRFLQQHDEWRPVYHSQRNNGFTVLARELFAPLPLFHLRDSDPFPPCLCEETWTATSPSTSS